MGTGHSPRPRRGNSDARRHRWMERRIRGHRRCDGGPWASRTVLSGNRHRVQDHPLFNEVVGTLREIGLSSTGSPRHDDALMSEALRWFCSADSYRLRNAMGFRFSEYNRWSTSVAGPAAAHAPRGSQRGILDPPSPVAPWVACPGAGR